MAISDKTKQLLQSAVGTIEAKTEIEDHLLNANAADKDIKFAVDGEKNIGALGANRPGKVFVKDEIKVGDSTHIFPDSVQFKLAPQPSNPVSGNSKLYISTVDGKLHKVTSAGVDTIVEGGGGGGPETDPYSLHLNGDNSPSADLSMGSHKLKDLSNGTLASDAVNKSQLDAKASTSYVDSENDAQDLVIADKADTSYVDSENDAQDLVIADKADSSYVDSENDAQDLVIAAKVSKAGDTMSGVLSMGANLISGVSDPLSPQDAATKAYVDAMDHGNLSGLTDDDHTRYLNLTGRSGGQTAIGGTAASNNLVLKSTSDSTFGRIDMLDMKQLYANTSGVAPLASPSRGGTASALFELNQDPSVSVVRGLRVVQNNTNTANAAATALQVQNWFAPGTVGVIRGALYSLDRSSQYAGSSETYGIQAQNLAPGSGYNLAIARGNYGVLGQAFGKVTASNSGANIGVAGQAYASSVLNIAVHGYLYSDSFGVSATNIAVMGHAVPTSGSKGIAGYFFLDNSDPSTLTRLEAGIEAALIVDNGSQTSSDIMRLYHNSTIAIRFAPNGQMFWGVDGAGGIGAIGADRPNAIVVKTYALCSPITEATRDAFTGVAGMIVFNSDTNKLQCHNGTTWVDLF